MPTPAPPATRSPAVTITLVSGMVGLLLSLNASGFALALFFCAVSLAALPMALADRPGRRAVRVALLGAVMAVLGLVLVLVPQLTGQAQVDARNQDPLRGDDRPALPGATRSTPPPPTG